MINQICFYIYNRASLGTVGAVSAVDIFTSVYAIIAYVIILLAIMIALVFSIMTKEDKAAVTVQLSQDNLVKQPQSQNASSVQINQGDSVGAPKEANIGFLEEDGALSSDLGQDALPTAILNEKDKRVVDISDKSATRPAKETDKKRFYKLSNLDAEVDKFKNIEYDDDITLKELCERFRNFAASRLGLYYDIDNIRRFIAGLGVSHIMILQGISGTGKTSLAYAFGKFLENPAAVISVQPMWKERTDLIGYYNEFTKRFNETTLLEKMYEANYCEDMFITILDEMNIARIEYYFAEFLSQLELPNPEERYLDVVTDKWQTDPVQLKNGKIKLPPNMWFIGTANNDDSTFSISDKVYDRAMVINLDFKAEPFYAPKTEGVRISARAFEKLISDAKKEYALTRRNQRRLEALSELLYKYFKIGFGNRIWKQIFHFIPIYLACGGDEISALDNILARKVMRKLEMQNTVYLKNSAEPFCEELEELFGEGKMVECKEYVSFLVGRR